MHLHEGTIYQANVCALVWLNLYTKIFAYFCAIGGMLTHAATYLL